MKKVFLIVLVLVFSVSQTNTLFAAVSAEVNGKKINFDVEPFIEKGRIMVPIRAFLEEFDANSTWDGKTKTVTILKDKVLIVLKIGEEIATVNGRPIKNDVAPILKNGRTFIPLRFIGEAFKATVKWDDSSKKAVVFYSASLSNTKGSSGFLNIKPFTKDELQRYNGKNGMKAYIAVDGLVYDVTPIRQWQNGEHNGFEAGSELSEELKNISPHGVEVLKKLKVVGKYVGDSMGNP